MFGDFEIYIFLRKIRLRFSISCLENFLTFQMECIVSDLTQRVISFFLQQLVVVLKRAMIKMHLIMKMILAMKITKKSTGLRFVISCVHVYLLQTSIMNKIKIHQFGVSINNHYC